MALFLLSREKGFANLLSVIVTTSILSWFFHLLNSNMFGVEDTIRRKLRTCVAYRFLCADCNTCYVGETSKHLSTRVREHLVSDRTSYIFGHLHNSPQCGTLCSDECFNILDHASTKFQLKIKEATHRNLLARARCAGFSVVTT